MRGIGPTGVSAALFWREGSVGSSSRSTDCTAGVLGVLGASDGVSDGPGTASLELELEMASLGGKEVAASDSGMEDRPS